MNFKMRRAPALVVAVALLAAILGLSGCAHANKAQSGDSDVTAEVPPVYEFESEELYITQGEKQIYGVLYRPKAPADEALPLAIFSHGYGGNHRRALWYAAALAERGFATFCFDFCGGGPESQSTGSTQEMSIFTERSDLEAVIAEMQKQPFVDSGNIFLIGASQGGVVSAITAAAHPDEIRGMVLVYPAFVLVDDAREAFASIDDVPDEYFFMGMTIGKAYYEGLFDFDIFEAIAPYKGDVLIIHGDADTIAPISYSERALDVYASAELKVIPGAQHGFTEEEAQQALEWILEYLEETS